MLIEFSVENFKSFRDRTTFSMIAANIKSAEERLDTENVIPVSADLRLLTSAAIYGKNASGKSNLGAAMRFMRGFVLNSASGTQSGDPISVFPFRLKIRTQTQPSSFEMVFLVEGTQYRYGFEADETRVFSEWLYYVPSRREYALFERDEQGISIKAGFKEGKGLEERTRDNTLFLSVVAQFNGSVTKSIIGWFRRFAVMSGLQDADFQAYTAQCLRDGHYKSDISNFAKSLDVDIGDLWTHSLEMNDFPESYSEDQKRDFISRHEDEIWATHPVYNDQGEVVHEDVFSVTREESQGTRKLISMAGPLFAALENGHILFIDEMDARLHTHMTAAIVKMFNSKSTNPRGAQLIFVTHDTNLLDNTLLRRDQIWFAEKDRQGATGLVSLAQYRERNDVDFEQRYLGGRYGGVPSLGELGALSEAAHG